jgi:hypothetical protein
MERAELDQLSRDELIAEAERLGVVKPRVLTQAELTDEILGRTAKTPKERAKARGWLGRARDLLATVVEKGLHLPEAARALRSQRDDGSWPTPPPPLPTVTLAEIYAAQGHLERAIATLDEVLAREPNHEEAKTLRDRFADQLARRSRPPKAPASDADEGAKPKSDPKADVEEDEPLPLDDEDLPDRYEVDEVVAIAVDPQTVYVYWEVRPTTLARARAASPDGALDLRVHSVSASWHGPEATSRDVKVDELYGERFLRDVTPGAHLRVSIGWLAGEQFEPFAVGMEVTAPRILPTENVAHAFGQWSPTPVAPFTRATGDAPPSERERDTMPSQVAAPNVEAPGSVRRITTVETIPPAGPHGSSVAYEVVEEIRQRVLERLRRTGASELVRERELVEERERRMRPLGGPFGGASDRVRGGASERVRGLTGVREATPDKTIVP